MWSTWWPVTRLLHEGLCLKKLFLFLWFFRAHLENEDFLIIPKLILRWRNADLALLNEDEELTRSVRSTGPSVENGGNSSAVVL